MVGWCQGGFEEIWYVPGGCTVSEKMEKENLGSIRLAWVRLEDDHRPFRVQR